MSCFLLLLCSPFSIWHLNIIYLSCSTQHTKPGPCSFFLPWQKWFFSIKRITESRWENLGYTVVIWLLLFLLFFSNLTIQGSVLGHGLDQFLELRIEYNESDKWRWIVFNTKQVCLGSYKRLLYGSINIRVTNLFQPRYTFLLILIQIRFQQILFPK